MFSPSFFSLRSTLLAAPVSTASSRVTPSLGRPALPCQPTQNAAVPRGLAWDSEHFMSLLPLPRPHARLSLQETRLSKWLTSRHGGDAAALECATFLCPNLIWIVRIFLSARSDGFTWNSLNRNLMMGVQSLGDGWIFGGKITRAFGSKLIRPDLSTKFRTLKELQFCSSRSETLLRFRHQRIFKVPPNLLSFYWKVQTEIREIWIKCYLNSNGFWDCVGGCEDSH